MHLLFGIHGAARLGTIRIGEERTEEGGVRGRRREEWAESDRRRRKRGEGIEERNGEKRVEVAF